MKNLVGFHFRVQVIPHWRWESVAQCLRQRARALGEADGTTIAPDTAHVLFSGTRHYGYESGDVRYDVVSTAASFEKDGRVGVGSDQPPVLGLFDNSMRFAFGRQAGDGEAEHKMLGTFIFGAAGLALPADSSISWEASKPDVRLPLVEVASFKLWNVFDELVAAAAQRGSSLKAISSESSETTFAPLAPAPGFVVKRVDAPGEPYTFQGASLTYRIWVCPIG